MVSQGENFNCEESFITDILYCIFMQVQKDVLRRELVIHFSN